MITPAVSLIFFARERRSAMRYVMGVLAAACLSVGTVAAEEPSYRLNPGDLIAVSVWKEEGLERQLLVLPDGTIQFPLVGELVASGRTVEEVQGAITERLKKFIPDAVVTVSVVNPIGNKIFVVGDVNKPGEIPLIRPLTVLQALSLAGGLNAFASETRIRIIRQSGDGSTEVIPFDFGEVKAGRALQSNITLQSGDTIVVPSASLF